jgi:hypothetical protein
MELGPIQKKWIEDLRVNPNNIFTKEFLMKRRKRRQRGKDRSKKWQLVNLVISKIGEKVSESIRKSFMWSVDTWGGTRCNECGLELPSKALLDRGVLYILDPNTKAIVCRTTIYSSPCSYVNNCGGYSTWDGMSFRGAKAVMKRDWKLILFRNLLPKVVDEILSST